jgi:hypothetical protein
MPYQLTHYVIFCGYLEENVLTGGEAVIQDLINQMRPDVFHNIGTEPVCCCNRQGVFQVSFYEA